MSDLCPTLCSLLALGFERRPKEYVSDIVGYRFRFLDLKAFHAVNRYFREVVFLNRVLNTGRTIGQVDCQIPDDLDDPRTTAAWVAMALGPYHRELAPIPPWLEQGARDKHLVNLRRRSSAPPAPSPVASCTIDRDHARILRRRLRETIDNHDDGTDLSVTFDGRILTVTVGDRVHATLASGEAWPQKYHVTLSAGTMPTPARFTGHQVPVVVYDSFLVFGSLQLTLSEPSP